MENFLSLDLLFFSLSFTFGVQSILMAKYGKKTEELVKKELHKEKQEGKWKNKKQAIAVGLSEAREKGLKVPPKKKS